MIPLHFILEPATQEGLEMQITPLRLFGKTSWREAKYAWESDLTVIR